MLSMTARLKAFNTMAMGCARITRKPETGEFRVTDMRMRVAFSDEGVYYTDNLDDAIDTAKTICARYTVC
jgi:hypothetical protein